MANADGSVIINTEMDTTGIKKGTEEAKRQFEEFGKQTEETGKQTEETGQQVSGLASIFKKLGTVIAAAGIVDKLIDIGKEAISLGSDLEEVQNVVDVTFPTMSKQVNKFAKDAQKSAGLSEKMAKQYVGTFGAMADSFGFTEAEAYEMSTALTQLTGDVASFYNLSQDEAATKLKGVFTGETEALKELGVVMTQAALDNYALANGYEKTTSAMSEQEKVALRYQFVMDQLSASSGDFVRTQDSWANQSKILALQWESLMATLGTGLISVLTPAMEFLNDKVLPVINQFAEDFAEAMSPTPAEKLRDGMTTLKDKMDEINSSYEENVRQAEIAAYTADYYKGRLEELSDQGLTTAESQQEYARIVERLNEIYPELNLQLDEQTGLLKADSMARLENVEALKQQALYMAMRDRFDEALYAFTEAQLAYNMALDEQTRIMGDVSGQLGMLTAETGLTKDQIIALYNAQTMLNNAINRGDAEMQQYALAELAAMDTTVRLTDEQMSLAGEVVAAQAQVNALSGELQNSSAIMNEQQVVMDSWEDAMESAAKAAEGLGQESGETSNAQKDLTASVQEAAAALDTLEAEYVAAQATAKESIDSQVGLLTELETKSDKSAKEIVENWGAQSTALDQYKANMQKAIEMGLDEALVKQLSDGSEESMQILSALVTSTDTDVDEINAAFQKTEEAKQTVANAMADVQTEMGTKLNAIEKTIASEWGDMNDEVRRQIEEMQKTINSLRGKTVYVNLVEKKSTSSSSSGTSNTSLSSDPYAAANFAVPYLAKGTVIPPNAPFMAVLGDQRRGTNIEAPLSTIQEAVRVELGDMVSGMMAGFQALLEEQQATRKTLESIEIGDSVIGAAADRYHSKLSVMTGGKL